MQEYFSIDEMDFINLDDLKTIDFSDGNSVTYILGLTNTNNLVRINIQGLHESSIESGARIVISKNATTGKIVINHKYDVNMLMSIRDSLRNINKRTPQSCNSACVNECSDFCSSTCYGACASTCKNACRSSCGNSCGFACYGTCSGTCQNESTGDIFY